MKKSVKNKTLILIVLYLTVSNITIYLNITKDTRQIDFSEMFLLLIWHLLGLILIKKIWNAM